MNYIFCTNCGSNLQFPDAPCHLCPTVSNFQFAGTTQIFAPEIETLVKPRNKSLNDSITSVNVSAPEKSDIVRFFQLFFITAATILMLVLIANS